MTGHVAQVVAGRGRRRLEDHAADQVAFILSNSETVRVSFVFGHIALSLIWVMIICAVLGAALAVAIPRFGRRR